MEAAAAAGMSRRIKAGAGKVTGGSGLDFDPVHGKADGTNPKNIQISLGQRGKFLPSAAGEGISPRAGAEPVTPSCSLFFSGVMNGVGSPQAPGILPELEA